MYIIFCELPKYLYQPLSWSEGLRSSRAECPGGPCALDYQNPPKVSVSELLGVLKGRSAIRVFKQFPYLKQKPCWGNHFWAPGYCVDTTGLNEDMILKYVKYQEGKERHEEQLKMKFPK